MRNGRTRRKRLDDNIHRITIIINYQRNRYQTTIIICVHERYYYGQVLYIVLTAAGVRRSSSSSAAAAVAGGGGGGGATRKDGPCSPAAPARVRHCRSAVEMCEQQNGSGALLYTVLPVVHTQRTANLPPRRPGSVSTGRGQPSGDWARWTTNASALPPPPPSPVLYCPAARRSSRTLPRRRAAVCSARATRVYPLALSYPARAPAARSARRSSGFGGGGGGVTRGPGNGGGGRGDGPVVGWGAGALFAAHDDPVQCAPRV